MTINNTSVNGLTLDLVVIKLQGDDFERVIPRPVFKKACPTLRNFVTSTSDVRSMMAETVSGADYLLAQCLSAREAWRAVSSTRSHRRCH